jgi:hypothetical protein
MQWADRIAAIILIGLALFLYWVQLPYPEGAAFFPKLLIFTLMGLSILLFIFAWIKKVSSEETVEKKETVFEEDELDVASRMSKHSLTRMGLTMGVSLVYFALMPLLGYTLATSVFVVILAYILGMRKVYISAPTAAALSISIFVAFKILLKVPLPAGILFK